MALTWGRDRPKPQPRYLFDRPSLLRQLAREAVWWILFLPTVALLAAFVGWIQWRYFK